MTKPSETRKVEERIDALLLEGLDSGPPIGVTPEYWDVRKQTLAERLETIQAVKEGLASADRGEGRPMDDVFDELERGPASSR